MDRMVPHDNLDHRTVRIFTLINYILWPQLNAENRLTPDPEKLNQLQTAWDAYKDAHPLAGLPPMNQQIVRFKNFLNEFITNADEDSIANKDRLLNVISETKNVTNDLNLFMTYLGNAATEIGEAILNARNQDKSAMKKA